MVAPTQADDRDHDATAASIAAAAPSDDFDARVAAVDFLRGLGIEHPAVVIGGYVVERRIGSGGFGNVYLATQPELDRRVALKLLHRERVGRDASSLRREANALAQLNHPNVVQVYHVGDAVEGTFIAMEYVEGQSLDVWQRGRAWPEVLGIYRDAALALAAAHARGVLHLDFKPQNVRVGVDGRARVLDFGLAGGPGVDRESTSDHSHHDASTLRVARAGGATVGYAAPEQLFGVVVEAATDQYAFCAALHEALHGVLPYTPSERLAMAVDEALTPRPRRGDRSCPKWIDRVIHRGLRPHPRDRWPTMHALVDALRGPPRARRAVLAGLCVFVTVPAALAATGGGPASRCDGVDVPAPPAWTAARRDAVARALLGDGDTMPASSAAVVLSRLDAGAASATNRLAQACGTRANDEPRLGCLRRFVARFDRATDLIADHREGARADALLEVVGEPRECDDVTGVERQPSELAAGEIASVLAELDRARLDLAAGRFAEANARTEAAMGATRMLDAPAVVAEALLVRGLTADALARDADALQDLEAAANASVGAGRDDLAAEAWRRAAWVAATDLADLERAWRNARSASAAALRLAPGPRVQAEQLDVEGLLLRLGGDAPGAIARHGLALVELGRSTSADDPRWISTWLLLAHAHADAGDAAAANTLYERAERLALERLGPLHPRVATILLSRAMLARAGFDRSGDPDTLTLADGLLARAAEIMQFGPGHNDDLSATITTLHAEVALLRGEIDRAGRLAASAWGLQREHLPEGHRERGSALAVLAQVELARGDWEAALRVHQDYALERARIDEDATLPAIENNLGWLELRLGRPAQARAHYQRALADGDDLQRAYAEGGLGHVSLLIDAAATAETQLARALASALALGKSAPADLVAEIEWHLAEALLANGGDASEIRTHIDRAAAHYRAEGNDPLAIEALEQLARRNSGTRRRP
ncbi:MAG: protein kinase [Deltaproteobacteria bacterium]|nr:protein kinase [Deltaproteobacteria bacterium]